MKTRIILVLILILGILQFFRPARNISNEGTYDVSAKYELSDSVSAILKVACNDCHSNFTEYPWYAEIQPIAWWLNYHVTDGKKHLNFSTFVTRPVAVQYHNFEDLVEQVEEGEMPLPSYTWLGLHPDAHLTSHERDLLVEWAKGSMASLKAQYPPDSLVRKRRP